jgi:hypothetical protein
MEAEPFAGAAEESRFRPCFSSIYAVLLSLSDVFLKEPQVPVGSPGLVPKTCPQLVVSLGGGAVCSPLG